MNRGVLTTAGREQEWNVTVAHDDEAVERYLDAFAGLVAREREELRRRVERYRGKRPVPDLTGRDVVLVDDGLATGVTAEAAVRDLRVLGPLAILLAVPVCARDSATRLANVADEVVSVLSSDRFRAVVNWYHAFEQTTDDEVLELLDRARR